MCAGLLGRRPAICSLRCSLFSSFCSLGLFFLLLFCSVFCHLPSIILLCQHFGLIFLCQFCKTRKLVQAALLFLHILDLLQCHTLEVAIDHRSVSANIHLSAQADCTFFYLLLAGPLAGSTVGRRIAPAVL